MRKVSTSERLARLALRHRLAVSARATDVAEICNSMVALHATDPVTVYLSAAARMDEPSVTAVDAALYDDRSVFRHHAMRRTLWVFTPEVARAAHASCTVKLAAREWITCARMVEDSGIAVDGAAWIDDARQQTLAALHRLGSAAARELGKEVPALTAKLHLSVGKQYAGTQSAHTRVLQNLGFDGAIVRGRQRGTWANGEFTWSAMDDWVPGGVTGMELHSAAAELARRYLLAFGPATLADLAWWAGWTATLAKQALTTVEAVEVALDDGSVGWLLPEDVEPVVDADPWVALLPSLDPTTMGWKERRWYLGEQAALGGPLFDRNGNGGPTIWADGRVVGSWAQRKHGSIATALFERVAPKRGKQIDAAIESLREVIGPVRFSARFPAPMQKDLLAH